MTPAYLDDAHEDAVLPHPSDVSDRQANGEKRLVLAHRDKFRGAAEYCPFA
jgi:hypothetical protein